MFKLHQINSYNWLSDEEMLRYVTQIKKTLNISNNAVFEKCCEVVDRKELLGKHLTGYVDCIDGDKVYEFKCTQRLEKTHYMQLAMYMYQHESNKQDILAKCKEELHNITEQIEICKSQKNNTNLFIRKILRNEFAVGDVIQYNGSDGDTSGVITKVYKVGKVMVINEHGKQMSIPKLSITAIKSNNDTGNKSSDIILLEAEMNRLKDLMSAVMKTTNYYLYNILTTQLCQVTCTFDKLIKIASILMNAKYVNASVDDDTFLSFNMINKNKYLIL
jgi:hypothetical protein